MTAITAMYWDVGGVLLTNGWDHVQRERVLARFGVDKAGYETRHAGPNDAWERGKLTVWEFLDQTVFVEPRSFTPEEFLAGMRAESQWLPGGALRILKAVKASDELKLAMLNNEGQELNDYRIENFGLTQYFAGFFSSCFLGMRKPEEKMFAVGLELMHQKAEETVFVDDRENNCAAAAKVGMHAIQYRGEEQLLESLRGLGLRVDLPD